MSHSSDTTVGDAGVRHHIALVGLMGSGKSSIGAILAERLRRVLIDTDHLVETHTGTSIAELFASKGEAAFRRYELDSLMRALARDESSVIATGGGVVTSSDARQMLALDATVVWLRASPQVLAQRIHNDATRPLIGGRDPVEVLTELDAERAPLYAEVAHAEVDAESGDPEQVAMAVLDVLGLRP